ncbi:hypothetical protein [Streptomyces griseosporeus]
MRRSRAVLTTVTAAVLAGCGGAHPPPEAGPDDRALVRADVTVALDALGSGHPQVVSVPRPAARPCTVVALLQTREAPRAAATARIAAVLTGRGWRQQSDGDERVFTRARWQLDVDAGVWPYARLLGLVADGQRPEGDTFTGVLAVARRDGCPAAAPG